MGSEGHALMVTDNFHTKVAKERKAELAKR
jgi:hypothetical protein